MVVEQVYHQIGVISEEVSMNKDHVFWPVAIMVFLIILFPVNVSAQNISPDWLSSLPVAPGEMYGIGHAKLADSEKAMLLAEEKAVVAAVYEHLFFIFDSIENYLNSGDDSSLSLALVVEKREITLSWKTADVEIIRKEQTSDGAWWCLAVYKSSGD
jgi:hypothetical protein